MRLETRKLLDKSFSGLGVMSIILMGLALLVLLSPIFVRGGRAFLFSATTEHRRLQVERFHHGNRENVEADMAEAMTARQPIYDMLDAFEREMTAALEELADGLAPVSRHEDSLGRFVSRRMQKWDEAEDFMAKQHVLESLHEKLTGRDDAEELRPLLDSMAQRLPRLAEHGENMEELKKALRELLGPLPGEPTPVLIRNQYGQTRWDRALIKLDNLVYRKEWDYSDPTKPGRLIHIPRVEEFKGTPVEPLFTYTSTHLRAILRPRFTFYWRFFTDKSYDAHFFGGIWPEILGTFYLTIGAMLFAVPVGIISAVYLCEYASEGKLMSMLRTCISTLAGVPSVVFGLFGLAFFINTVHVSPSKSVLAGSLTLALLILPTVIRASEEAIRAVPHAYKEAALSLGAGRWHTVLTVILPAALPGILTGIVISMGRAAGETAPIIFTAAVSVGRPLGLMETLSQPTPALPWNIYNLCTEHEAVDEIRHVQYGMVLTLVALVLLLNVAAIVLRARISKKLKG